MAGILTGERGGAGGVTVEVVLMPRPARRRVRPGSPIRPVWDPLRRIVDPLPQFPPQPEPEEEPDQPPIPVPQPPRPVPPPLGNRKRAA